MGADEYYNRANLWHNVKHRVIMCDLTWPVSIVFRVSKTCHSSKTHPRRQELRCGLEDVTTTCRRPSHIYCVGRVVENWSIL